MTDTAGVSKAYEGAKQRYADCGVDTERALERLAAVAISLHCWQGDDVGGFEHTAAASGGGIQATGNYPGKARTADELRADLDKAISLIPGTHRLNLHAMYAETAGRVDRNQLQPEHFGAWIDWAKAAGVGMDFNPTYFAHPLADSGFTLSSRDEAVRRFWVEHGIACRRIAAHMGEQLGSASVHNIWIPDGFKDLPADRRRPREILQRSLDEILAERFERRHLLDSLEGKLFGIGSESYVVGSHEFYLGYAVRNRTLLCLDTGHFHPTEEVADKISAVLAFLDEILLHVSRGVRWDSDHVVILSDPLRHLMQELVRGDYLGRVHIGLDYFDASINRVAAWVIGTRCTLKALLLALLEPTAPLQRMEAEGDYTGRLALLEEAKTLPFPAVWEYYCQRSGVPADAGWLDEVRQYERDVLRKRT
ncbi:MAG: L-rhamnose isomerase [Sedimentisphaerales bacterium]|nr:L-rhamnose isomerase [Sedimentisphaerales bacterium]